MWEINFFYWMSLHIASWVAIETSIEFNNGILGIWQNLAAQFLFASCLIIEYVSFIIDFATASE